MHSVCKSLYQWRCANFIILFLRRKIHHLLSYFYNNHRHRFITFFRLMNLTEPNWGLLVWQTRNQLTQQWNVGFWREKCQGRMENSETQFTCGSSPDFSNTLILLSFFVFYESPVLTHWRATEFPIVPLCPAFSARRTNRKNYISTYTAARYSFFSVLVYSLWVFDYRGLLLQIVTQITKRHL